MQHKIKWVSVLSLALVIFSFSLGSAHGGWRRFVPFVRSRSPETLIVTGNFAKARLLAEVAQLRRRATILLITQEEDGEQVYFMENYPDARLIPEQSIVEFLNVLAPDRIIVLGGEQYVPTKFHRLIRSRYPMMLVTGDDWIKNARAVANIVEDRRLVEHYRYYLSRYLDEQVRLSEYSDEIPMRERVLIP